MTIPICAVTGRIAGDADACGDCNPCGAAHMVPDAIKGLLTEKEEWRQKYGTSAAEIERLRVGIRDHAGVELSEENDRLIDEIKRLRAAITNCSGSCGSALGDEQTREPSGPMICQQRTRRRTA